MSGDFGSGIYKEDNTGRMTRSVCQECGKGLSADDAYGHDCEVDEQGDRIRENYKLLLEDAEESGHIITLDEFEQVFEDRDPFEFI